jgi:lysine-N-methylase
MPRPNPDILDFYPRQRYTCQRCGLCCRRFEVKITAKEANDLKNTRFPDGCCPPDDWFVPSPTQKGICIIAKDETGDCVLMDETGSCRLHKAYGLAVKPLICRVFPLHVINWKDGRSSAELRFVCPAVGDPQGALLGDQPEIMANLASPLREWLPESDVAYSIENPLPLPLVRQIHAGYKAILQKESLPLKTRLYAVARILDFHASPDGRTAIAAIDAGFATAAGQFVDQTAKAMAVELARGKSTRRDQIEFRLLISGYLRDDDPDIAISQVQRLKLLFAHSLLAAGGGNLQWINPHAPDVKGRHCLLLARQLPADEEALDVLRQFFYGKLESLHFCGNTVHGFTYDLGMKHLLLSVPVIFVLAAAKAQAANKSAIGTTEMLQAIRFVDLTFAKSPFFKLRRIRDLLVRLARPAVFAGILSLVFGNTPATAPTIETKQPAPPDPTKAPQPFSPPAGKSKHNRRTKIVFRP